MTHEEFMLEFDSSTNRSKRVLLKKQKEYASDSDVLENFRRSGQAQNIPTPAALVGMMTKQFISLTDMVKCPELYNISIWNEKITDIRNYTYLLDALLREDAAL